MKNRRNYYRILHVQPDAPLEIIKSCYRALLLKLKKHPDLGGDQWESALLNEAKDVLFDPGKRAEYDRNFGKKHSRESQSTSTDSFKKIYLPAINRASTVFSRGVFSHTCSFCRELEHHSVPLAPDSRCSCCRSPLFPTRKIKRSEIAKRAFQRIAQNFGITYYTEWPSLTPYHGQTSQLSPTGMQFFSDQYLQPGQIIKVHSRRVEAVARVVYCCSNSSPVNTFRQKNITGVEFLAFISLLAPGTFVSQTS
jgi:curved DNA-binding protein CbpA